MAHYVVEEVKDVKDLKGVKKAVLVTSPENKRNLAHFRKLYIAIRDTTLALHTEGDVCRKIATDALDALARFFPQYFSGYALALSLDEYNEGHYALCDAISRESERRGKSKNEKADEEFSVMLVDI